MKSIQETKEISPEINVYEGKDGLRAFINLALKEKEFCAFGSTGRMFDVLYETPRIAKSLEKSNVNVKIIGNTKYKGTKSFSARRIQFRYLNIKSEATTSIFGDYVSIHLLTQKPIVILIKNKEISEGYKNYFEILWKIAKK